MAKKPSCKRIKYLIKDEDKATREYGSYGHRYRKLSRQEKGHKRFLKKEYKRLCE